MSVRVCAQFFLNEVRSSYPCFARRFLSFCYVMLWEPWQLNIYMKKKLCRGCIYKETTKKNLFVSYLSHYMYFVVRLCIFNLFSFHFISHIFLIFILMFIQMSRVMFVREMKFLIQDFSDIHFFSIQTKPYKDR